MKHLNRWRTVGAAAATSVLAFGALGIASAVTEPAPIELVTERTVGEAADSGTLLLVEPSLDSPAATDSPDVAPTAPGSPDDEPSMVSATEAEDTTAALSLITPGLSPRSLDSPDDAVTAPDAT
ncbi:MAG: hypothetical protein ACLFV0_12960, partial [Nitriliruptoraceae bacterium]